MKIIRILILEDDIETVYKLAGCLSDIQREHEDLDLALTTLSDYFQVERYLNKEDKNTFDVILLDRDCFSGGSFHVLDFEKYPLEKIIAISSTPPYNAELKQRGVKRIVHKDYENLDRFVVEVKQHIEELLGIM